MNTSVDSFCPQVLGKMKKNKMLHLPSQVADLNFSISHQYLLKPSQTVLTSQILEASCCTSEEMLFSQFLMWNTPKVHEA